jgi:hypothetical protein
MLHSVKTFVTRELFLYRDWTHEIHLVKLIQWSGRWLMGVLFTAG